VDDAGDEVGQTLAYAGAGLEEEWSVGLQRSGDGGGHSGLFGAVVELELGLQIATFLEDTFDESKEIARWLWRRAAAGIFDEADHFAADLKTWRARKHPKGISRARHGC
jgi:hypothetical protein